MIIALSEVYQNTPIRADEVKYGWLPISCIEVLILLFLYVCGFPFLLQSHKSVNVGLLKKVRLLRHCTRNDKNCISMSLRASDQILRMHRKENNPRMPLRRSAATVAISILPRKKPSIFLGADSKNRAAI